MCSLNLDQSKILSFGRVDSLPNDKFLVWFKFKAFAKDKINVTQEKLTLFGMGKNIAGNRENAGYQHFLHFPQCFQ